MYYQNHLCNTLTDGQHPTSWETTACRGVGYVKLCVKRALAIERGIAVENGLG